MDFHSLARRDLQFLCKKNRVPANLTNVAMAKALEALETVEGIEEIQEALGLQYSKVKSPELLHAGRRISSRGVTNGDELKINDQQQKLSPFSQSHGVTIKTLDVTGMSSKEEIQETLGFQSLKVDSPELPHTGRRTSVRRAVIREEPKIQQQKTSPLHRSHQAAAKYLEVTEMASKEDREEKEVPTILPKTPATRKATKGVEAQSSRRRAKKNEEVEGHTETPKAVEAKGGKAIGVVTRRITRLSSRKALEETITTQPKSRSSSRENAAIKMEALAKEDAAEQEKEEEKKDLVEYGDSCVIVENECETNHEDAPIIQQQQPSLHPQSCRVTTKAPEAIKKVSKEEKDDKKAPELLPTTSQCTRLSSRKPVEEKSRDEGTVNMVALAEEGAAEQEKKDLAEKRDSCVITLAEEDEEKDQKVESHGYSSLEEEDSDSIIALGEEVEKNDQVEIHDLTSSAQEEGSNIEVENDHKTLVEGDEMTDQKVEIHCHSSSIEVENSDSIVSLVEEVEENNHEVEIHGFSSSTQREDSNIEVQNGNSTVVFVEGDEMKYQKIDSHDFSSNEMETSKVEVGNEDSTIDEADEAFESMEESSNRPPVDEYVKDSGDRSPEKEFVEIASDQLPENKSADYCLDQSPENGLMEDPSNHGSEFDEVSGDLLPTNETVEDSCDHSSNAKLAILAVSDNLPGSEIREIDEEEEGKLSLLFAEMTLREVKECGDALPEPVLAQADSFVSKNLSATMVTPKGVNHVETDNNVIPQDDCYSQDLPPAMVIPAVLDLGNDALATEAIGESPEDMLLGEIPAADAIEKSINKDISLAGELTTNDSVDVQGASLEISQSSTLDAPFLFSSTELCAEFLVTDSTIEFTEEVKKSENLHREFSEVIKESVEDNLSDSGKLVANKSVDVLQKSEILLSEFSTADFTIRFKEVSSVGQLSEIPNESAENYLHELAVNESFDVPQKTEISQGGFLESQSPVTCTELCSEFSKVDSAHESKEAFGHVQREISAVIDESVKDGLLNSEEFSSEKSVDAETSQDDSSEPQIQKEETKTLFLKEENLDLLSLTKLRAMYKQMLNVTKKEGRKKSTTKEEDLVHSSCIKHKENCSQKLNDDMIKLERKKSLIKQEDLECRSRGKLDSNCKKKLNEDKITPERKRTPLKNLNYSAF